MEEIFKPIKDYENYMITNKGRIFKDNKEIKIFISKNGYCRVQLWKNGKCNKFLVHRLVAKHFLDDFDDNLCVNHIDENKLNNCIDNLELCNHKFNNNYGTRNTRISNTLSKKVNQYDLQGNLIKTWNSIQEAKKVYKYAHISECCNNIIKKSYGYIWRYAK